MKYLKTFESHIGAGTSWTMGNTTITLKEINDYLDDNNIPVVDIDPKTVEHLLIKVERSPERVQNDILDFPIVLAEKSGEYVKILDGQHRVVKCLQNNIGTIKARVLDLDKSDEKYNNMFG